MKRFTNEGVEIAVYLSLTCSDDRIHYLDFLGVCDMNTISVGTISWCSYRKNRRSDIFTSFKRKMHLLAVLDLKVLHNQVFARPKS